MPVAWDTYTVTLTLLTPLLGTVPADPEVYARFLATKAPAPPDDEEPLPVDRERAGWTTFYRIPGTSTPCLRDYQLKGYLKEVGNILKDTVGVKALRSKIDTDVWPFPRHLALPPVAGHLERPLRAMTMQGPRVTVMRSDRIDPGATLTATLAVRAQSPVRAAVLTALLEYGAVLGLGQWRTAGFGRFAATLTPGAAVDAATLAALATGDGAPAGAAAPAAPRAAAPKTPRRARARA
jgi:hypothetical protein